ncbi:MAG: cytochrome c biogenesis protein ResB [Deltaproteobacteria bacterium]|nr:cytochrome c biogenesis protein ResB [Deltaproteobacteria bacterium]MBZ0220055.1 cytochrome c biogenesis protein ResB [Deltaproteobacteria bacterium]
MRSVWKFFSSVYLTIVLAVLICVISAWGSIVVVRNQRFFGALDHEVLFPFLLSLKTEYIGLTLWVWALILLTAVFAVNTVVCTIDKAWSVVQNRRPWQALFPHIVHVGFLIALLGHLVGSVWGFRSYGHVLYKGESIPVPYQGGIQVRLDETEMRAGTRGDLDYLRTRLTLVNDDGSEVVTKDIGLNNPLIWKGIAFYHFDQGQSPTGLVIDAGGSSSEVLLDGSFSAPDGSTYRLGSVYPDFALDESGKPFSRSGLFANPHIEIISADGSVYFLNISEPGTSVKGPGHSITLKGYVFTPYVVLTINKDPGIIFIIAGSIVLVVGMVLLLFFRGERAELVRPRPGMEERGA